MESLFGIILVVIAGLIIGSMVWPMKVCKNLSFGHMWLSGMVFGLLVMPWAIVLLGIPNIFEAYRQVPVILLIKANAFSLAWGVANVLMGLAIIRIGVSLTMAILTAIGASIGVILPMILKGSGLFAQAPSIISVPGFIVMAGVAVMLFGIILCAKSGRIRESDALKLSDSPDNHNYLTGLLMVILAGVLSAGISFTFIFSQHEIVSAVTANGAGPVTSNVAVWAVGLIGGMLVNIIYPIVLVTKSGSWKRFIEYPWQVAISAIIGIQFFAGVLLMGQGMVKLGPLGASVGFGMAQSMQIIGGQILGFVAGEWKLASAKTRKLMYTAIAVLLIAVTILAGANTL